jgi:hypothetical protein
MELVEAGAWGLAGGLAAGLLSLAADVTAERGHWPWSDRADLGPRLFVMSVGMVLGALVSAAAHSQMSGEWPALIMGCTAPSVLRGAMHRVEVTERKSTVLPTEGGHGDGAP